MILCLLLLVCCFVIINYHRIFSELGILDLPYHDFDRGLRSEGLCDVGWH